MSGQWYDYPRERTLVGGYVAVLTAAEANAWHDYVEQTDAFREMESSDLDANCLSHALCAGLLEREADYRAAVARKRKAIGSLYKLAETWVAALPREQPTEGRADA